MQRAVEKRRSQADGSTAAQDLARLCARSAARVRGHPGSEAACGRRAGHPAFPLGIHGEAILEPFLEDVWQRQLVGPAVSWNSTGQLLLDAELCTQVQPQSVYEDYRELVGMLVWNPARSVQPFRAHNPAGDVLREHGFDLATDSLEHLRPEQVDCLEQAMRVALGPAHEQFTREEIYDGLLTSDRPLVACAAALPLMRARLSGYISQCTSDEDLLRAASAPNEPLLASGAARIQVLNAGDASERCFGPDLLDCRMECDLRLPHQRTAPHKKCCLLQSA